MRLSVAAHPERICPYQRCPQVHFVAVRADGSKCRFNGLDKTDADRARECDRHDKCLAFRLAAGWEVRGRWEAFKYRVFVDLIDDFRKSCRSQDGGRKLFAWTLSAELQDSFRSWLRHDRQPCSVVEQLRRITREDPELSQTVDKAVAVVAEQFSQPVSHRPAMSGSANQSSQLQEPPAAERDDKFTPMQRQMLRHCLEKGYRDTLRQMDPSRDERAESKYQDRLRWFDASREDVRYGHKGVSPFFRNGSLVATSIEDMELGQMKAEDLPALVGVYFRGAYRVVFGNRRLYACKEHARRSGRPVWLKMIVHDFPTCPAIRDERLRAAFCLKAIDAMDTQSGGTSIEMRGRTSW